jgi:hypothetical protein
MRATAPHEMNSHTSLHKSASKETLSRRLQLQSICNAQFKLACRVVFRANYAVAVEKVRRRCNLIASSETHEVDEIVAAHSCPGINFTLADTCS